MWRSLLRTPRLTLVSLLLPRSLCLPLPDRWLQQCLHTSRNRCLRQARESRAYNRDMQTISPPVKPFIHVAHMPQSQSQDAQRRELSVRDAASSGSLNAAREGILTNAFASQLTTANYLPMISLELTLEVKESFIPS